MCKWNMQCVLEFLLLLLLLLEWLYLSISCDQWFDAIRRHALHLHSVCVTTLAESDSNELISIFYSMHLHAALCAKQFIYLLRNIHMDSPITCIFIYKYTDCKFSILSTICPFEHFAGAFVHFQWFIKWCERCSVLLGVSSKYVCVWEQVQKYTQKQEGLPEPSVLDEQNLAFSMC